LLAIKKKELRAFNRKFKILAKCIWAEGNSIHLLVNKIFEFIMSTKKMDHNSLAGRKSGYQQERRNY